MKVLTSVALTSNQKRVLAKIVASPTPRVAGEEISGDRNLAAARDDLAKLGAIESVGGEASMTDKGEQLARDENIIDDAGQLTQDGQALAYTTPTGEEDKDVTKAPATTPPGGMPGGAPAAPGAAPAPAAVPPGGAPAGGQDLFMSYAPTFKEFLENEEQAIKKVKAKKSGKAKPESYQEREDRRELEASREDRLRKPAGQSWGDYYKSM